jgi:hypothetical protein
MESYLPKLRQLIKTARIEQAREPLSILASRPDSERPDSERPDSEQHCSNDIVAQIKSAKVNLYCNFPATISQIKSWIKAP